MSRAAANSKLGRAVVESIRNGDDTGAVSLSGDVKMERWRHYTDDKGAAGIVPAWNPEASKRKVYPVGSLIPKDKVRAFVIRPKGKFCFGKTNAKDTLGLVHSPSCKLDFDASRGTFQPVAKKHSKTPIPEFWSKKQGSKKNPIQIYNITVTRID